MIKQSLVFRIPSYNLTMVILIALFYYSPLYANSNDDTLIILNLLKQNNLPYENYHRLFEVRNNRIIKLDLSAYTLSDFSSNDTGGSIGLMGGTWDGFKKLYKIAKLPDDFYNLDSLQFLNLSFNGIDSFPLVVLKLKELRGFDYSGNRLKKLPPNFTELENLSELHLCFDSLQIFPLELLSMKSLRKLNLSNNQITILPDADCAQFHLDYLNVSGNKINHFPPAYCECRNIKKKDYSRNSDWITTKGCNRFSKAYGGWPIIVMAVILVSVMLVASHFSK